MPVLDVVDETFIEAPVDQLCAELCDEKVWAQWGLDLTCYDDRGLQGKRWRLGGALTGTAEIWLEESHWGVVVHLFVQADPVVSTSQQRLQKRHARPVKRWILDVKRRHDTDRPAGEAGCDVHAAPRTSMGGQRITPQQPDEEG